MAYQQQTEFIVYCFVLRIVMAMGTAAADTASFAILAARFPSHISSAFGLIEMAVGVGQTLGPAMGGFLTEASYYNAFALRLCFLLCLSSLGSRPPILVQKHS